MFSPNHTHNPLCLYEAHNIPWTTGWPSTRGPANQARPKFGVKDKEMTFSFHPRKLHSPWSLLKEPDVCALTAVQTHPFKNTLWVWVGWSQYTLILQQLAYTLPSQAPRNNNNGNDRVRRWGSEWAQTKRGGGWWLEVLVWRLTACGLKKSC